MKLPHKISRIEAFSDAIFAFAATLLVVSVGSEESSLQINWLRFLSFGVSFFALAGLWSVHYNYFRRTKYLDNWIIALNCILLFLVLYYIFPLRSLINSWTGNLILDRNQFSALFQLYSLGFMLIFACYALIYLRAYKGTKEKTKDFNLLFYARHFGIYVFVAIVSIVLARFHLGLRFGLPGIVYVLLGPFCYFHGIQFKKTFV